jgi:alpha-glucosidase
VASQCDDPGSILSLYRELIALRRTLPSGFESVDDLPGVVAFRRGDRLVAINTSAGRCPVPGGEALLATTRDAIGAGGSLAPGAGAVIALG